MRLDQETCWLDSDKWPEESQLTSLTCPSNLSVLPLTKSPRHWWSTVAVSMLCFQRVNLSQSYSVLLKVSSNYNLGSSRRSYIHKIWTVRQSPGCIFVSVWGWPSHWCQCATLWLMALPTVGEGSSGGRERRDQELRHRERDEVFSPPTDWNVVWYFSV